MSFDSRTPSLTLPTPAPDRLTTLDQKATPAAEREKLSELAAQFESTLMLEMIKQMRKSLIDDASEGDGLGKETYSSTIDSELAMHLAKAGGMGLTPMLVGAWERQQGAQAPGTVMPRTEGLPVSTAPSTRGRGAVGLTSTPAGVSAIRPAMDASTPDATSAPTALSLEMGGRVSSTYGWRADPFKGQSKFHGGIDLAVRYGTEVPAAAAGTVVTAQEQGGYGLTVVVRHANGFESRYAHLSSLDVKAGDTVAQGQQVGRVGSTGRSTGPHLHFEVTQAGHRVDPERFVRNLTSDIKGQ